VWIFTRIFCLSHPHWSQELFITSHHLQTTPSRIGKNWASNSQRWAGPQFDHARMFNRRWHLCRESCASFFTSIPTLSGDCQHWWTVVLYEPAVLISLAAEVCLLFAISSSFTITWHPNSIGQNTNPLIFCALITTLFSAQIFPSFSYLGRCILGGMIWRWLYVRRWLQVLWWVQCVFECTCFGWGADWDVDFVNNSFSVYNQYKPQHCRFVYQCVLLIDPQYTIPSLISDSTPTSNSPSYSSVWSLPPKYCLGHAHMACITFNSRFIHFLFHSPIAPFHSLLVIQNQMA